MNKKLPNIFIGSSTENLDAAYAIQENLEHDALCRVWTQGIFDLSNDALDNLLKATDDFEFAIFVFNPDDITKIRENDYRTVRDNVIFEFGLFVSKLGKEKVFFLIPHNSEDLHLPTDLIGLEPGKYYPQDDKQKLLGALGPFCNKIRKLISNNTEDVQTVKITENNTTKKETDNLEDKNTEQEIKEIEYGVAIDKFENRIITQSPTVFFSYRFAKSFPGNRDILWIDDPVKALDRLELLLREPLKFERSLGYKVTTDPIWWFRGHRDLFVDEFRRLSQKRFLMDIYELDIKRIAAFNGGSYWQSFVYVETKPDKPIGLYTYTDEEFKDWKNKNGFVKEEYGLYEDIPITRNCYDDGAADIDGKIVDTSGAKLRARVLTDYNFIISSKYSPINSREFRMFSDSIYNGILDGTKSLDNIIEYFITLPRHHNDD